MRIVDHHTAKTRLSRLLDAAAKGEEIFIARDGFPVARLVPLENAAPKHRQLGRLNGIYKVPPDFDAPLPDDILDLFENG